MTSFRFLHAADIHLDSPLRGLSGQEGNVAARIRGATREALEQLVGSAIEEGIDFLVIAGDLYDGDWRDFKTGLFFAGQMGRLNRASIPVYLLHGNHDAESQLTRRLSLPENVHVFSSRKPQTFQLDAFGVALHGQSFRQRDIPDNLVPNYPEPSPGAFNIGVLHTGLGGMGGHANYAPCSLEDLTNKGYDYWALGHVHQSVVLHEHPHVVFPGNLQGRHIRETGPKGACLVTVEDHVVTDLVTAECDFVRWAVVNVPVSAANSFDDVLHLMRNAIEGAVNDQAENRLLACRVILEGRNTLHGHLFVSRDQLLNEARAFALGIGDEAAWIEKVVVATEPALDPGQLAQREDAIGELQRLMEQADSDHGLVAQIESDIGVLARNLPPELRADVEDRLLKMVLDGDHSQLISEIVPQLHARLLDQDI